MFKNNQFRILQTFMQKHTRLIGYHGRMASEAVTPVSDSKALGLTKTVRSHPRFRLESPWIHQACPNASLSEHKLVQSNKVYEQSVLETEQEKHGTNNYSN
jgi:hypothetical protein